MKSSITMDREIEQLYETVPEEQLKRFQAFRERYPYQTLILRGISWRVIDTKTGSRVLLVPPGGTGVAEISWQTLQHLAEKYRVITFDFPPLGRMQELMAGVIDLLDRMGISRIDAMGGSGGTLFLQPFLWSYPDRIGKIALVTPIPLENTGGKTVARILPLLRLIPTRWIRGMVMKSFERLGKGDDENRAAALVMAQAREIVQYRLQRENFLALFSLIADMGTRCPYNPDSVRRWTGKMLLIFGTEDPSTPADVRAKMSSLYPQAKVILFEGGSHTIAVTHQKEYFEAIDNFLSS
jgi:pimeloyl-ACP methyl ester carboxylesterase